MRASSVIAAVLFLAPAAWSKAIESFGVGLGTEAEIQDGSNALYLDNVLWVEKGWKSFERNGHTLHFGAELSAEPIENGLTGQSRWGFDTQALFLGYKFSSYLPDWYNFAVRLRVPVRLPGDPFGRERCAEEPLPAPGSRFEAVNPPACADHRELGDRLQLKLDPLFVKKSWNTFALHDRSRFTVTLETLEYGNYLKLIDITPDLEFPIAMWLGDELRIRGTFATGSMRVRNDFIVGLASNLADWAHLAVELKYHLDTSSSVNTSFMAEMYVELYFDVFFDNTTGGKTVRGAHEERRE